MIIDLSGLERAAILLVSYESSCGYVYTSWAGVRGHPSALASREKKQVLSRSTRLYLYIMTGLEQIQTWGSYDNLPELEHFLRVQQSGDVFMVVLLSRVLCVALEGIFLKIFCWEADESRKQNPLRFMRSSFLTVGRNFYQQ